MNSIQKIKENKFLFEELVKRDFTKKYKRTVLGMLWSILGPLMTLGVMALVFKQLSSGMKARIAFSIASMLDPEILILDEVLAVGDGGFSGKSEAKMMEIINNGKATILVSHSIQQIRRLFNKVLWIDHGKQIAFGPTGPICDKYEEYLRLRTMPEIPDTLNGTY